MACGPGKLGDRLVPDAPLGFELRKACIGHDECYSRPAGRCRCQCDAEFLTAMLNAARQHAGIKRRVFSRIARRYYVAVRLLGWIAWWRSRRRDR